MKIYADTDNRINKLDDYIGQNIWVPVWFDDYDGDLYGWVMPLSHKYNTLDGTHHYLWYKSKLIRLDDVIRYKNRVARGDTDDWQNYVKDYTFESQHFDYIDLDHAVTEDELDEEFNAIYSEYRNARGR